MNDGEIWLKSLNDRGQFLLTRRKRYNESTDWWILRFKSWLIGSKRILQCLLRSVARRNSLDRVGNVGFGGKAWKQFSASCKFVGDKKKVQKGRTREGLLVVQTRTILIMMIILIMIIDSSQ